MRVIIVTGTDTEVGKTVATAAIAAALAQRGVAVHVDKPVQTGAGPGDEGDAGQVSRLTSGLDVRCSEGLRASRPMAPVPAAARDGLLLPSLADHAERVRRLAAHRTVVVEGSGGLLVELDSLGGTLADLPAALAEVAGRGRVALTCEVVVVVRPGLGTLNHTALTLEALERRRVAVAGLVIGAWPDPAGEVELDNLARLRAGAVPLLGALPPGLGSHPAGLQAAARALRLPRGWAAGWPPLLSARHRVEHEHDGSPPDLAEREGC